MIDSQKTVESRANVIALVFILIALTILASITYKLPAATNVIYPNYMKGLPSPVLKTTSLGEHKGFLLVGDVIRLVIWIAMGIMILLAAPSLTTLINYYLFARIYFKVQQKGTEISAQVAQLSSRLSSVLIIALVWPLTVKAVNTLLFMDAEGEFDWVMLLLTLAFVAATLVLLYLTYSSAQPVLQAVSKGKINIFCAKCGAANLATARFCAHCGSSLEHQVLEKQKAFQRVVCPRCGAENNSENNFCTQCGALLSTEL